MISNNMYNGINILGKSLDASLMRHNVISENIANEDTPGYKRKDVKFEGLLQEALLSNNKLSDIDTNALTPQVVVDKANLSYRLDGNNVNIDTEMTELTKNQIKFNVLVDQVSNNFSRIKTVLSR
ncbi:flagellar basal body rod protein FlgB [Vallitalea guaymasensis]|uniref:Flagellar basal body rod protein FlgB n=1 Tax=Vallitalea guaymasensis TaxID=1185412 RepID=A0A8J8SE12_9FIRM|nr:flagellar basal body rod protein FlgB [Vallitalea guaymasensis]QUH31433.1 flagellar basal body rod protein FlgB [Vallitalea guaymasensis]